MTRHWEYAIDPEEVDRKARSPRAWTPTQALVESAPGDWPDLSVTELLRLRTILADALDLLAQEERELVNAYFVEQRQLRALAREWGIPKTTLARRRDEVLLTLRIALVEDPLIAEYLEHRTAPQHGSQDGAQNGRHA